MTTRTEHLRPTAIRAGRWVLAWLAMLVSSVAQAQEGIVPIPSPVVIPTAPELSPPIQMSVRGPCDPDYWIISSRACRCEVLSGQACAYQIWRFQGSGPGRCSSLEEFLGSLQPGVPICFMAHGSFVTFESMLRDSAMTYQWLRQSAPHQPVHMVFYTWNSDEGGCIPHLHVNGMGQRASLNGFYLADLVTKTSPDHPICLIGHSHGTRMVASALEAMAGGEVEGMFLTAGTQQPRRIRVVLAAAAIDHDWLNPDSRYGHALCQAEAVINLQNRTDFPLLFYPLRRPVSARALAVTGLTPKDRMKLGCWNDKIIDYDVTDMIGAGHIWCHYYRQPSIATIIRHYVYFDDATAPVMYSSAEAAR